jgi:predicted nucleic acid-binding protein
VLTVAPGLLPFEVADALYRRVLKGEISANDARTGVQAILDAGPVLLDHTPLHAEAIDLASDLGRRASFDAYYLALAQRENCECWTADWQFWDLARDRHPRLRWVGEEGRAAEEAVPEQFVPKARDWFSPTVDYSGRCKACFSDPQGFVEGPGRVVVEETGEVWADMVVEAGPLNTEGPYQGGRGAFLRGEYPRRDGNGNRIGPDLFGKNPCTGLEVETTEGTFRTSKVRQYGTHFGWGDGGIRLTFTIGESVFDASDAEIPEYWVLPLTNFLSEFQQRAGEMERHPLRVFPTPEIPPEYRHVELGPDEKENNRQKLRAAKILGTAYSRDQLIRFEFGEGLGFVERLSDNDERARALLEGRERHKTTAVMVGPTGGGRTESFGAMREWFPFDVLSLLTLASGAEVGAPWVEIRDGAGGLVRRLHSPLFVKAFREGHRLIQETSMTRGGGFKQTGRLIERAVSRSQKFGETFVRIAIVYLVRSAYEDQSLDNSISYLSRGIDLLCKRYGMSREQLGNRLPPSLRAEVREILNDAARRIRELDDADPEAKSALNRIQGIVQNADGSKNHFGPAVADLLKAFDLYDADILQEHYKDRRRDGWTGLLSEARGDVTHNGYLPILEEGRNPEELVAVSYHLHDALARVIFKILEYDGGYNTRLLPGPGAYPVDWVESHLSAKALGYPEED